MPSTIPKPRRHLPRSRELECPACGQMHAAFSCVPAEEILDCSSIIADIKCRRGRVGEWPASSKKVSALFQLRQAQIWLEGFQTIIQELAEKEGRG
jgi:hypothetical protein